MQAARGLGSSKMGIMSVCVVAPFFPPLFVLPLKRQTILTKTLTYHFFLLATMGNGTTNSQWPTCVGCAILHRSFSKTGTTLPEVCEACFREFCWDGSLASEETTYNPGLKLGGKEGKAETSGVMAWREDWYRILVAVLAVCLFVGV